MARKTCSIVALVFLMMVGLWLPARARATLIEKDLYASGDALITLDTRTLLEWLDVTETQGMSYNDVLADVSLTEGGWHYATDNDVASLFTKYVGSGDWCFNNIEFYWNARFVQDCLGITANEFPILRTHGFLAFGGNNPISGDGYLYTNYYGYITQWFARGYTQQWPSYQQEPMVGHFLIRPYTPIPEPATMLLVVTGLISLAGFRRKLKK